MCCGYLSCVALLLMITDCDDQLEVLEVVILTKVCFIIDYIIYGFMLLVTCGLYCMYWGQCTFKMKALLYMDYHQLLFERIISYWKKTSINKTDREESKMSKS